VNLLQLYYFRALAEREHLYQTAMELYISPSALSTAISRLENELGVKLFDRVGRNIRLNDNGKKFQSRVVRILDELDRACTELKNPDTMIEQRLNVVTSTHVLWEDPFSEYIRRNPSVQFNHHTMSVERIGNSSLTANCDFIITALADVSTENYEYAILIPNDRPVLAVYEGHPFAGRKEISLSEARSESFIALSKTFSMRRYFDNLCEIAGFKPKIVAEGDYSLRAKLIKDGMGITISTVTGSKSILMKGLKFIEISEPIHPRVQAIFWRKGKELSPHARAFKSFLQSYYENYPMNLEQ